MFRTLALLLTLALAALAAPTVDARLRGGLSGAWYDPAAPGHGISIEILEDQRALVFWSVFDPSGAPLTLYIESRIEGDSLVGTAYAPRGMRFGSFDRSQLSSPVWGRVRIDFSSCDSATLSYDADGIAGGADYGRGTFGIRRLTRIAGTRCSLAPGNALPVGRYQVEFAATTGCATSATAGSGAVDGEGRLWAVQRSQPDWLGGSLPLQAGDSFYGCYPPPLTVAGRYLPGDGDAGAVALDVSRSSYFLREFAGRASIADGERSASGDAIEIRAPARGLAEVRAVAFRRQGAAPDDLSRDVTLAEAAGVYRAALSWQFSGVFGGHRIFTLIVASNGELCRADESSGACTTIGTLRESAAGAGFFDFSVEGSQTTYRGRAWLQPSDDAAHPELVMAGDDPARHGFGLILRRD